MPARGARRDVGTHGTLGSHKFRSFGDGPAIRRHDSSKSVAAGDR